jgi:hypothetical protein
VGRRMSEDEAVSEASCFYVKHGVLIDAQMATT